MGFVPNAPYPGANSDGEWSSLLRLRGASIVGVGEYTKLVGNG